MAPRSGLKPGPAWPKAWKDDVQARRAVAFHGPDWASWQPSLKCIATPSWAGNTCTWVPVLVNGAKLVKPEQVPTEWRDLVPAALAPYAGPFANPVTDSTYWHACEDVGPRPTGSTYWHASIAEWVECNDRERERMRPAPIAEGTEPTAACVHDEHHECSGTVHYHLNDAGRDCPCACHASTPAPPPVDYRPTSWDAPNPSARIRYRHRPRELRGLQAVSA